MCYVQKRRKNTAPHQEPTPLEGPGAQVQPCYLQICDLRLLDGAEYSQESDGEKVSLKSHFC